MNLNRGGMPTMTLIIEIEEREAMKQDKWTTLMVDRRTTDINNSSSISEVHLPPMPVDNQNIQLRDHSQTQHEPNLLQKHTRCNQRGSWPTSPLKLPRNSSLSDHLNLTKKKHQQFALLPCLWLLKKYLLRAVSVSSVIHTIHILTLSYFWILCRATTSSWLLFNPPWHNSSE